MWFFKYSCKRHAPSRNAASSAVEALEVRRLLSSAAQAVEFNDPSAVSTDEPTPFIFIETVGPYSPPAPPPDPFASNEWLTGTDPARAELVPPTWLNASGQSAGYGPASIFYHYARTAVGLGPNGDLRETTAEPPLFQSEGDSNDWLYHGWTIRPLRFATAPEVSGYLGISNVMQGPGDNLRTSVRQFALAGGSRGEFAGTALVIERYFEAPNQSGDDRVRDPSFGTNGRLIVQIGDDEVVSYETLAQDGSIWLGIAGIGPGTVGIMHITADGRLDLNFGHNGLAAVQLFDPKGVIPSDKLIGMLSGVVPQPDGTVTFNVLALNRDGADRYRMDHGPGGDIGVFSARVVPYTSVSAPRVRSQFPELQTTIPSGSAEVVGRLRWAYYNRFIQPRIENGTVWKGDGDSNPAAAAASTTGGETATVYRAYNPNAKLHFLTTSQAEYEAVMAAGYQAEPADDTGFAVSSAAVAGSSPLHRLYDPHSGVHYFTFHDAERDFLVGKGWRFEKDEGYIYTASGTAANGEVYHLYNTQTGSHFFTESAGKRDEFLNTPGEIWVQHASLGFAMPSEVLRPGVVVGTENLVAPETHKDGGPAINMRAVSDEGMLTAPAMSANAVQGLIATTTAPVAAHAGSAELAAPAANPLLPAPRTTVEAATLDALWANLSDGLLNDPLAGS